MPQVLKDEVRDKIITAAKKLFVTNDFGKVSMSMIAGEAGIAVGNIYRYFKGKDQLFRYLAKPVASRLMELFKKPMESYSQEEVEQKIRGFLEIYDDEKDLLYLLLENSHNTEFNNLKEEIVTGFSEALFNWRNRISDERLSFFDDFFIRAYASAYVNGIISILTENCEEHIKRVLIYRFSTFMKDSLKRDFTSRGGNA